MNRLSADRIREAIGATAIAHLETLEIFDEVDSTNTYLLGQSAPEQHHFRAAMAEFQSTGRGRRERRWISPPSSGVCLSLAYTFQKRPDHLPSLSLAVATAIAEVLEEIGVADVGVKWPNDVFVGNAKICGILSEVAPSNAERLTVVVGIGLNVDLGTAKQTIPGRDDAADITDLVSCCAAPPSRSVVAAAIIEKTFLTLQQFAHAGFSAFLDAWNRYDCLRGRHITVDTAGGIESGFANGVDQDGALLLKTNNAVLRITSGSVTLDRGIAARHSDGEQAAISNG